ncbi:MAG: PEGA domain-containing protein [Sandaracinus sp.]|nr:PEGA domain-containing protein [Sandaracinus sp.]MCB9635754.1 PEGA domain-containing protein [Sandaracinus sp.]
MLRSIFVALALVLTLAPATLQAQQPNAQTRNAARDAYGRGQTAFREGRFEEAEAAFTEAFALIPNPVVLLGVAESRERLGNVPGAIQTLEQYLVLRTDAPDAAEIQARLAALRATPGTLAVQSTPEGATISVDGNPTGAVTPVEMPLPAGEHQIALELEGHEVATTSANVPPGGRAEASANLTALPEPEPEPVVEPTPPATDPIEEEDATEAATADDGPGVAVWVTSGVAAAALVGGTVLGFMALSREAEFDDDPTEARADDGERFALFADVLFGVAGAAAITAIVLFLTNEADEDDDASATALTVSPSMGRRGGGVSAQLRF